MEQRLSLITLGVADLPRARAFYEALSWTTRAVPDADIVFFQAGFGYAGIAADPDGHAWEVAHNPRWTLHDDGSISLAADRG